MSAVSQRIDHRGCKVNLTASMLHWGTRQRRNYGHDSVDMNSLTADVARESDSQVPAIVQFDVHIFFSGIRNVCSSERKNIFEFAFARWKLPEGANQRVKAQTCGLFGLYTHLSVSWTLLFINTCLHIIFYKPANSVWVRFFASLHSRTLKRYTHDLTFPPCAFDQYNTWIQ